jgi:HEAT repeat protein
LALLVCISISSFGCNKKEVTYQDKPLHTWIEMLESPDPAVRTSAILAVGEIGPEARKAIPMLIEIIRQTRNHDKRMLLAANTALLKMGKEIVPHMVSLLEDKDWEMRRGAAWILGKVGPDARDALPALTDALEDPNPEVRAKAAHSLKQIMGAKPDPQSREPNVN